MSFLEAPVAVSQIQAFGSTFSGLTQELNQSAPSGGFQDVLDQMQTALQSLNDIGEPSAPVVTESAALTPTSMLTSTPTSSLVGSSSTGSSLVGSSSIGSQPVSAEAGSATGSAVVADASQYLGVPYVWGGTSPAGFDCSGLVQYVFQQVGVSLPRTSQEQALVGTPVSSLADAQPGDLVFFPGSDGTAASPGHVGIYIGNGQMIVAPHTGTAVQIQAVGDPTAIRRVLPTETSPSASSLAASSLAATSLTAASLTAASPTLSTSQVDSASLPANLGVPADLAPLFESAGQAEGVSPALLAAVAKQESGFQPTVVSGAGAEGLMQLMPSTAASLGVNPMDPAQAIDGAAVLLRGYLDQYSGSVPLALAAYNAGPGAVQSAGGVPPFAQTQNYIASITGMLGEEQT